MIADIGTRAHRIRKHVVRIRRPGNIGNIERSEKQRKIRNSVRGNNNIYDRTLLM